MNGIDDFIVLNCLGTLMNMSVNTEMLNLTKEHFRQESETMKLILDEFRKLNEELKDGTDLQ